MIYRYLQLPIRFIYDVNKPTKYYEHDYNEQDNDNLRNKKLWIFSLDFLQFSSFFRFTFVLCGFYACTEVTNTEISMCRSRFFQHSSDVDMTTTTVKAFTVARARESKSKKENERARLTINGKSLSVG